MRLSSRRWISFEEGRWEVQEQRKVEVKEMDGIIAYLELNSIRRDFLRI